MKECKSCELAVYCFSDASTWVFRTKQEMEEKQAEISNCPVQQENRNSGSRNQDQGARSATQGSQGR